MLGQLAEADKERLELRLMSDPAFTEEFDMVVDEIAALYVSDRFTGDEKERVERYFLESAERQNKVQFMGELLRQLAVEPAQTNGAPVHEPVNAAPPAVVVPPPTGMFERLGSWWRGQSVPFRAVTSFATLLIIVGAVFWFRPGMTQPTFASLELAMTSADRNTGTEIPKIKLSETDELRLKLKVPADAPAANSYRAQLRGARLSRELPIQQQDAKSLMVVVPANDLARGSYAIELTAVTADGKELPLRGAYLFAVE